MIRHVLLKISPNPSFPKRGIPPFRKGREEGFSLQRPYNYGLISNIKNHQKNGFIVLDILIAGLILTASIAATMYLFRMGFDYLERANQSNLLSTKLTQATGLIRTLELEKKSGEEDIGEGVTLKWNAQLLGSSRPTKGEAEFSIQSIHELLLYRVLFNLNYKGLVREYKINVFRYKPLFSPEQMLF